MQKERLSKIMAQRGLCSRREADRYIERGLVFVDGARVSELGTRVDPGSSIHLDASARVEQDARVTFLLNKPSGYVSGQPEDGYPAAVSLIHAGSRWSGDRAPVVFSSAHLRGLAPAGRLDIDSTGLLALTQDGRIARRLVSGEGEVDKEYLVRVAGRLTEEGLRLLNHGLSLDGHVLRPAVVTRAGADRLRFILREGRKRQIRRMCEGVGLHVVTLKRIRIGRVELGGLPPGKWRYLAPGEPF